MKKKLQPHQRVVRMARHSSTPFLLSLSCLHFAYAAPSTGGPTRNNSTILVEALAADKTITGKIVDETNSPLPGVSIVIKGTQRGTVTDANGQFRLDIPERATLVLSFVGYEPQEVVVGNQTVLNVTMKVDSKVLEEIVVIGYGTLKKSDLTGAVGSVKAEQLMERPAPSLTQALSGRMPGVQVNTNSGRPGGRTTIRVRGFSSINSSNNPLYVVDGVMLPQGNQNQFSSAIDYINPNDIVSVEVLKDASSTAIYGARGANGVILVTTKKEKQAKVL